MMLILQQMLMLTKSCRDNPTMVGLAAFEHPSMAGRITIEASPQIASNSDPDHLEGEEKVPMLMLEMISCDYIFFKCGEKKEKQYEFHTEVICGQPHIDDGGGTNEGGNVGAESETHLLET